MRYKCKVAYVGTAYAGFQSQPGGNTIQDKIEAALAIMYQEKIRIIGSSRTDSGVHAYGQVFHFDAVKRETYQLKRAFDSLLPKSIRVTEITEVSEDFHARFSVKEKTYIYVIYNGDYNPFLENRAFQKKYPLDYERMKQTASLFVGKHDFGSFTTASYDEYPDQVRTLRECTVIRKGKCYLIKVTGDGFLRHMVRIMAGAIVDVGRGQRPPEEIAEMLACPTKKKRRYNIDACGLYLVHIRY